MKLGDGPAEVIQALVAGLLRFGDPLPQNPVASVQLDVLEQLVPSMRAEDDSMLWVPALLRVWTSAAAEHATDVEAKVFAVFAAALHGGAEPDLEPVAPELLGTVVPASSRAPTAAVRVLFNIIFSLFFVCLTLTNPVCAAASRPYSAR